MLHKEIIWFRIKTTAHQTTSNNMATRSVIFNLNNLELILTPLGNMVAGYI